MKKTDAKAFPENLRRAMFARKTNTNKLGHKSGIFPTGIRRYLNGVNSPNLREFCILCEALEYSPDEMIYGFDL